ncbi:carbohydrate ABC transporter substrate-binding protein [Chitinibacter bivalviorum]|uniref:Probable sugar-binding periplasmic protein n=1 Tax=Chitinibacter bivalviorum TaxID=2739434 RepID=A0A7H9BEP4_9NEIS|nr:ABC transporter substrate-binding protein [Chitinibacter bivalviorum]QLG87200.1 carbohydrate ABC transporter substrate-binding protein [Chitinibacter bivalviorum]
MRNLKLGLMAASMGLAFSVHAAEVEVLHYWTSGGEAKAAAELKKMMEAKGNKWKDFAVAGGGGENAMTALKTRVVSGNPPAAAQIKGPSIQEWGDEGVLTSIDGVAKKEGWDKVLPPVVSNVMKYKGQYVAAPVNVHRVNWLWINPELLKKANAKVPNTWDEFFVTAAALQKAGIQPLAYGGQPWQDSTVFESVALGVGGVDFYKKAFVQLDPATMSGPTMIKVLETYKKLKPFTDKNASGREWNLATSMVINGKAAMQFMGDWAKGEFLAAGKVPGKDFLCVAAPGTANAYTFNIDSFAFFKLKDKDAVKGQMDLASTLMSPEFQEVFNLNKGSIPARTDLSMAKFDECGKKSAEDFKATSAKGSLVPSWAHGMAMHSSTQGAVYDVVTQFWNDDKMSAKDAASKLAAAAKTK